jgi:hypothetical protein
MPTNFPTSVDNFTNPTANDSLNLPSHSTQHANANDAIEAIETYMGLVWINTTTVSGASLVTFSNVFSSTFADYLLLWSGVSSVANAQIAYRNANTGTPTSGSNYNQVEVYSNNAVAPSNYAGGASDRMHLFDGGTASGTGSAFIFDPFLATPTRVKSSSVGFTSNTSFSTVIVQGGSHTLSTSYDGFVLTPNTGTITGDFRLYGLRT